LLTGASGGIGKAVAEALYVRGANLVLTDLSQEALDTMSLAMGATRILPLALDVTDIVATKAVVTRVVNKFGKLDLVFANAGIAPGAPTTVATISDDLFERVVEVDLLGVWRTVKACLPHIIEARGHVLVTASIYAFANGMINAPYAVSKAGVEMFGRALRAELAGTGATAGVLYPGWIATPMTNVAFGGNRDVTELRERIFLGPFGKQILPEVVAKAVVKGVEKRSPRIIVPKRWIPLSLLRGLVGVASDALLDHYGKIHDLRRSIETQHASAPRESLPPEQLRS